ncbi:hypothetical protein M5D96_000765 [Drosophila gunungcola]|uniref:Uncharacterized protein n=1 Tax=Drosophila gunungcola TaxID=103775 RepID=A0A9P9YXN4_9MUSC|nr:hypothetical protein M5D96_000765 [Drosophila gunungcola]
MFVMEIQTGRLNGNNFVDSSVGPRLWMEILGYHVNGNKPRRDFLDGDVPVT